jgi:hypothetical protein
LGVPGAKLYSEEHWDRREGVRTLLPDDQQLLTDQQLRDASDEQLQDLIARIDLLLRTKGQPGLTVRPPQKESDIPEPSDPADPADSE